MYLEVVDNPPLEHLTIRTKILDVAETLFAKNGFNATSLRAITSQAGVNVAAVNYYFRSKDQLIVAVLSRAIRPINEQRVQMLEKAFETFHSHTVPLAVILEALIRPCLEIRFDPKREQVFRLLARSLTEEGNFIGEVLEKEWSPIISRFAEALQARLPEIPLKELFWRIHFIIGAMIHTACHLQDLAFLSKGRVKPDLETALKQLIDFASAGLKTSFVKNQNE
jgi:AcrR family transcriptional regulator